MSEPKTKPTGEDVEAFLAAIPDAGKREDCRAITRMMTEITGAPPVMWGSMVGFDTYHYRYASGREGDAFITGFSPRKQNITLYIMAGFDGYEPLLANLGKHSVGKACLYIKRLSDVDQTVLRDLIAASVAHMRATNPLA